MRRGRHAAARQHPRLGRRAGVNRASSGRVHLVSDGSAGVVRRDAFGHVLLTSAGAAPLVLQRPGVPHYSAAWHVSTDLRISDREGSPDARASAAWRRHRGRRWIAGLAALAVLALIGAALIPSGGSKRRQRAFSVAAVAGQSQPDQPAARAHHEGVRLEHPGQDLRDRDRAPRSTRASTPTGSRSDLSPIAAVARSTRRSPPTAPTPSAGSARLAARSCRRCSAALASGGRGGVQARLDRRLRATTSTSARSTACCPARSTRGSTGCPSSFRRRLSRIPRLHRASPDRDRAVDGRPARVPGRRWRRSSSTTSATLRRVLPTVPIEPLDYATRAHEILEDAQRDLLSGTDVPLERRRRARDRGRAGGHPGGDRDADAAASGPRQHARLRSRAGCCSCSSVLEPAPRRPPRDAGRRSAS